MNNSISVDSGSFEEADRSMPAERLTLFDKLSRISSLSQILRAFGACAVIASMSLFMLQGWSEGNDITRYLKLLGQTGLLTGVGLLLSFVIKEYKGARIFFGLSLISVVANFTILGALTYSMTQWDRLVTDYPDMMKWVAIDPSTFAMVFVGAVALLAVVTRFSFSIFARHISGPLTISFLGMCSLLLLPVRSSMIVCALAGVSFWIAARVVKRLRANEKLVMTLEAKAAMAMLFLPALIMVARAVTLYKIDEVMVASLCGLIYLALRTCIAGFDKQTLTTRVVEISQFGISLVLSLSLIELLPYSLHVYKASIFIFVLTGLLADQLFLSRDKGWSALMLSFTAFTLIFSYLWLAVFGGDLSWQVNSLVAATTMLTVSWLSTARHGASLYERYGLSLSVLKKHSNE